MGTDHFRAWWAGQKADVRAVLKASVDELKLVAEAADRELVGR